jgi:carbonic anhydrase/acetyltransferase-like protein (isoleucine patch superfamily)
VTEPPEPPEPPQPLMPLISSLPGLEPDIHADAWVAPGAVVVGQVTVGARSSIWYGCVLRGDDEEIRIGDDVNVQDLSCLHADPGEPCVLEDRVSVGHKAMVHGAYVESGALVGIGAVVLGAARIGAGALVAAGAVVRAGAVVPPRMLVAGVPARVVRALTDAEAARLERTWSSYVERARRHRSATPT